MCVNFAPARPRRCAEDDAPDVRSQTAANFCDYFRPNPKAHDPAGTDATAAAMAELERLFGGK